MGTLNSGGRVQTWTPKRSAWEHNVSFATSRMETVSTAKGPSHTPRRKQSGLPQPSAGSAGEVTRRGLHGKKSTQLPPRPDTTTAKHSVTTEVCEPGTTERASIGDRDTLCV